MFKLLLLFIFIRPFIASVAFPLENSIYSFLLFIFLILYIFSLKINKIQEIKYPLIFFFLSLIVSFIFSYSKLNNAIHMLNYFSGILLFIIVSSISAENKIKLIRVIFFCGLVASLLAIYQYFFGFQHLSEYVARKAIDNPFIIDCIKQKRVFSPFMTPNILAGFLVLVIFLVLTINNKFKWLIFFIIFTALLFTKSLGGILSFFIVLGVYFYLNKNLFTRKSIFLLAISAITIVIIFSLRLSNLKQSFLPGFSLIKRIEYWQQTIEIIKSRPFTGIGIGNLNLPMSRYSHNLYLQLWAETGIIGLVSFFWLIGSILRLGLKNIENSASKVIPVALFVSSVSFLIDNFISFSFFLPEVGLIWWGVMGLLF